MVFIDPNLLTNGGKVAEKSSCHNSNLHLEKRSVLTSLTFYPVASGIPASCLYDYF